NIHASLEKWPSKLSVATCVLYLILLKASRPHYALSGKLAPLQNWNMSIFYHSIISVKRLASQGDHQSPILLCPISQRVRSGIGYSGAHNNLALAGQSRRK